MPIIEVSSCPSPGASARAPALRLPARGYPVRRPVRKPGSSKLSRHNRDRSHKRQEGKRFIEGKAHPSETSPTPVVGTGAGTLEINPWFSEDEDFHTPSDILEMFLDM